MFPHLNLLGRALWRGIQNGIFATAKAAAYSAILTFFPALIVVAWVLAETHTISNLTAQVTYALERVLPPSARIQVLSYLQGGHQRPLKEIYSASTVMLTAASGVMVSWMDGFRRAYQIEKGWSFWRERAMAFFLVLLTFVPLAFAFFLIAFGNQIESWMALHSNKEVGYGLLVGFTLLRWTIATVTSVFILMLLYHWALPRVQPFHRVLPGAILVTLLWFPFTLLFGWYVTRYATYNMIYGPLATAIALLVWLYGLSIIIMVGAEYNAMICPRGVCDVPSGGDLRQKAESKKA